MPVKGAPARHELYLTTTLSRYIGQAGVVDFDLLLADIRAVLGKPPATWRITPAAGAPSEPAGGGRLLMYSAGN